MIRGRSDFSKRTLSRFENFCSETVLSKSWSSSDSLSRDHFFSFYDFLLVYENFASFGMDNEHQTNFSYLICRNIIITDVIDSLNHVIEDKDQIPKEEADWVAGYIRSDGDYKNFGRGCRIPQASGKRLKCLLPLACFQLLTYFQQREWSLFKKDQTFFSHDLIRNDTETTSRTMHDSMLVHTATFRYPGNGHYYIALNSQAHFKFKCV